jgi:hypothetical protein
MSRLCLYALGIALSAAACGATNPASHDAGADAPIDAGADASRDAAVGPTRAELTGGGGRLIGGTLVVDVQLDVQLGAPLGAVPTTGGTVIVRPAPAITP